MKPYNNETIGTLYIVATPIGNMGDITLRAIETLKEVNIVACEDTRVTGLLLHKLGIKKLLKPIHQHSLDASIQEIIDFLMEGKSIAYVTDGGTPGISDPGQRLVAEIRNSMPTGRQADIEIRNNLQIQSSKYQNNCHSGLDPESTIVDPRVKPEDDTIMVIPVPGPSALTAAVSVSGMVEKEFYFAGFLPKKKGRQTWFKKAVAFDCPIIIYESALRLERTLKDIQEYLGENTEVFIAREMTKMFEEYWGGSIGDVLSDLKNHKMKGEVVMIIQKSKIKNQKDEGKDK